MCKRVLAPFIYCSHLPQWMCFSVRSKAISLFRGQLYSTKVTVDSAVSTHVCSNFDGISGANFHCV